MSLIVDLVQLFLEDTQACIEMGAVLVVQVRLTIALGEIDDGPLARGELRQGVEQSVLALEDVASLCTGARGVLCQIFCFEELRSDVWLGAIDDQDADAIGQLELLDESFNLAAIAIARQLLPGEQRIDGPAIIHESLDITRQHAARRN